MPLNQSNPPQNSYDVAGKIFYFILIFFLIILSGCERWESTPSGKDVSPEDQSKTSSKGKVVSKQEEIETEEANKITESRPISPAVDHKILEKFLPGKITGFLRLEPTGVTSKFNGLAFSTCEVLFTSSSGTTISVQILDYAGIDELYAPYDSWINSNVNIEDEEGFVHTIKIKNFPAFESYQKKLKTAQYSVIVGNRIIVDVNGTEVDDFNILRKVINSINLNDLGSKLK